MIREMDWKSFFEQNNAAERVLRQDPSGAYPHMDDESRQMYRKVIQDLARQSLFSEEEVARQAVLLAMRAKARTRNPDSRSASHRTHVGYYLMAAGSRILKERIGYKPSIAPTDPGRHPGMAGSLFCRRRRAYNPRPRVTSSCGTSASLFRCSPVCFC